MRFAWLGTTIGLALVYPLGGCSSGQTGSPSCVGPLSCVCDAPSAGGTLLHVHVERVGDSRLEAVVDEVFAPSDRALEAQVGDRVGGMVLTERPCASDAVSTLEVGGELLVLFSAGYTRDYPSCSMFQSCAASECAGLDEPALSDCWGTCDAQTREFCSQQRSAALLEGTFGYAVPWQETLSFGGSAELPRDELSQLFTRESCLQRFPAEPVPPCDDTPASTACSSAPPAPGFGAGWPAAVLAALLLGRVVSRRAVDRRGSSSKPPVS